MLSVDQQRVKMFCSDCGTKLPENVKFCSSCGKPQEQSAPMPQPPVVPPPPAMSKPPSMPGPPPIPPPEPQGWSPPPVPGYALGSTPKRVGKMNKGIYWICIAGGMILGVLLTVWGATDSKVDELLYFSWIPFVPAFIAMNVMIYKMWAAIQDGHARTTPGKAVGFMFIPIFSLYWFVQVFYGWAKDYNSFITRRSLNVPQVSESTFLIYVISSFFCFPVAVVMMFIVIKRICLAVNVL